MFNTGQLVVKPFLKLPKKIDPQDRSFYWCAREDLNLHVLANTSTSS